MAASLPVEIIQSVLLYLDLETYVAARLTCRAWRCAASNSHLVRNALEQAPVLIPAVTRLLEEEELNAYLDQIARLHLFPCRSYIEKAVSQRERPKDCSSTSILASSCDNGVLVALKGGELRVYNQQGKGQDPWEITLASSLYPLWTSVCRAMIDGGSTPCVSINQRYAHHHLAVSSRGHLVAIGLGKTIQIYDLNSNEKNLSSHAETVLGQSPAVYTTPPGQEFEETDGVVEALEFTDDDKLLRVTIGKETTSYRPTRVRYLGDLRNAAEMSNLDYWRANINRVYLDSAALAFILGDETGFRLSLRGLRLLPPSFKTTSQHYKDFRPKDPQSRCFVAALQTPDIDGYCIGSANCSADPNPTPARIVQIHRVLPSRYYRPQGIASGTSIQTNSNIQYREKKFPIPVSTANNKTTYSLRDSIPRWDPANLPSATFSSPLISVSPDNKIAVIYEPGGGKPSYVTNGGSIYVYNIEACTSVYQPLQIQEREKSSKMPPSPPDSGYATGSSSSSSSSVSGDSDIESASNSNSRSNSIPTTLDTDMDIDMGLGFGLGGGMSMDTDTDIVPPWPFLLDRVAVDIERLDVRTTSAFSRDSCDDVDEANVSTVAPLYTVTTSSSAGEEFTWRFPAQTNMI